MNLSQGNHKLRLKNVYERENPICFKYSFKWDHMNEIYFYK